jgi:DNA polymerase III delta subunit
MIADDLAEDIARARAAIDELRQMPEPPAKLLAEATKTYRVLLRMHGLQSQRIGTLATRLRLTPQSRYAPSVAGTAEQTTDAEIPPWLDYGVDRPQ